MRAAICSAYGPPESVRVQDSPAPEPGAGQARVRVHAAAVNFPDVLLIADQYQMSVPTPFVPGSEFAGVVEAVGEKTSGVAPGDRVSGTVMVGAFAEQVAADVTSLRRIPDSLDFREAAASGVAHSTAFHALKSFARIGPGDELVVLGAGGGVGLAAVQLGSLLGASVTAVASTAEKLEVAASYGAVRGIEHRSTDLRKALREQLPGGADAVIDPVGGALAEPALRSLRWGGRFVSVGFAAGEIPKIPLNLVLLKGVQVVGFQFRDFATHALEEYRRNEAELLELLAQGRASAHIGARFPLEETAAALRYVADGKAIGKVIIDIPG